MVTPNTLNNDLNVVKEVKKKKGCLGIKKKKKVSPCLGVAQLVECRSVH